MKRKQPQISEDTILRASWELLGEVGLEKFSLRRLATKLGIQAPSLYWYFKSKQKLYQRLANDVSKHILLAFDADGDWKNQLHMLAVTVRDVLRSYPCSTQLMMMTLPHEPDIIRFTNRMLACVESTPLKQEEKLQVVTTLINYVFYFVLDDYQHERNISTILEEADISPGEEMIHLLNNMSDKEAGLFHRTFSNELFELMGTDRAFEFGLNVILLGIEQVIKQQA